MISVSLKSPYYIKKKLQISRMQKSELRTIRTILKLTLTVSSRETMQIQSSKTSPQSRWGKRVILGFFPCAQLVHLTIGFSPSAHSVHFVLLIFHFAQNLFISFCSFLACVNFVNFVLLISYFCLLILYLAQNECIFSSWFYTLRKACSFLLVNFFSLNANYDFNFLDFFHLAHKFYLS